MPRPYPPEFRARAIALVRSGKQVKHTACELEISAGCLHNWLKQDRIDHGELPGRTSVESVELRAARKRIRELETELAIVRQAEKFLGQDRPHPKGSTQRSTEVRVPRESDVPTRRGDRTQLLVTLSLSFLR
jgi:transposase